MSDSNLRKCLHALRSAQSDNERFAALMMVTKVVRAEDCDDDTRRQILEAMGFRFLTRLMKTTSVPEGCPTSIYKSIALSILSSFTQDPEVVSNPEIQKQVTVLNEVILGNVSGDEEDTNAETMLSDCYDCLRGMLLSPVSRRYLTEGGTQCALVEAVVSKKPGNDKACEVLLELLKLERSHVWNKHPGDAHKLLRALVAEFKMKQDATKFEVGEILTVVLSTIELRADNPQQSWVNDLVKELYAIIRSKLDDKMRDSTLCLVSSLVSSQGMTCVLPPFTQDLKLLLLVTHMACIEVRMVLEDGRLEQIQKKSGVVCSCYGLLENLIGHMTTGTGMGLSEKQILQLHSAMMGAFNSVIFFLSQVERQQIEMPTTSLLVTASVRVLGAWLAEETSALREEIYSLLPFLVHICKQQIDPDIKDPFLEVGNLNIDEKEDEPNQGSQTDGHKGEGTINSEPECEDAGEEVRHTDMEKVIPGPDQDSSSCSFEGSHCHSEDMESGPGTCNDSSKSVSENPNRLSPMDVDRQIPNKQEPNIGCAMSESNKQSERDTASDSSASDSRKKSEDQDGHVVEKQQEPNKDISKTDSVRQKGRPNDSLKHAQSSAVKCKKSVSVSESEDIPSSSEVTNGAEVRSDGVDLVKFLLPAMCHLTAEEKPREIILRENVHVLLVDYFQKQMTNYLERRDDYDLKDTLASLCGIFLNLTVTEAAFVAANHKFHELLSSLLTYLPATALDIDLLILTGNFVTLGLMMLRHQNERTDISSENRDQFLAGSINFLSKAHSRVKRKPPMLAVSEPYRAAWDDISELWFLSMQGLSALIPIVPNLSKLIMKSGWIPTIMRILLEVEGAGVDADSQSAFISLLTTLALNDTSAKRVIKEKRGIELAKMYLCEDLQSALTTS